jgi:hypothetical protein
VVEAKKRKPAAKKPAKKAAPKKMGRPSGYTQAIADRICNRLAEGESLRKICLSDDMPATSSVCKWLTEHPDFAEQYTRAREAQADKMAEEILQIADDGMNDTYVDADGKVLVDQDVIARSRLRVDARKWLASKMAPKKYGDKVQAELSGVDGGPIEQSIAVSFVKPK